MIWYSTWFVLFFPQYNLLNWYCFMIGSFIYIIIIENCLPGLDNLIIVWEWSVYVALPGHPCLYSRWLILHYVLFAQRRALPAVPTTNGLSFVALQTEKAVEPQLAGIDIVLHKATDEIVSVVKIQASTPADRIQYSDGIQKLQRCENLHWKSLIPLIDCLN